MEGGLARHLLSLCIDNQGWLHSLIKASSRAPECNRMKAHFLLFVLGREINVRIFYVESWANTAVEPALPPWILQLWARTPVDFAEMLRTK